MALTSLGIGPELQKYMATVSAPVDELLLELAEETKRATGDDAGMQIAPEQGALLTLLAPI